MHGRSIALAALLLATLATPASAAKIVVPSAGITTIQQGILAASPGDTVLVKSGVYRESVLLLPGKHGLKLKAKGQVVIEPRGPDGAPLGPGLRVLSPGVRIQGFIVRNAAPADPLGGEGILCAAEDVRILDCEFRHCDVGVRLFGAGALVKRCDFRSIRDDGIYVEAGSFHRILGCSFAGFDGWGIHSKGANTNIRKCSFTTATSGGVFLEAAFNVVEKCSFFNLHGTGVATAASLCTVRGNRIRHCFGGVYAVGDLTVVTDNRVDHMTGTGIDVEGDSVAVRDNDVRDCQSGIVVDGAGAALAKNDVRGTLFSGVEANGDGCEIVKNRVRGADVGIRVSQCGADGLVEKNDVRDATFAGLWLEVGCTGVRVLDNTVHAAGGSPASGDGGGYFLFGSGHVLLRNVARRCLFDGFQLSCFQSLVEDNVAEDCGEDGFQIKPGANLNIVRYNRARKNGAEGFEHNASGTTFAGNKAVKNRLDVASNGLFGVFAQNEFQSGGELVAPEVDF